MRSSSDVPARIGRFEVLGRLATGGMAEIFLARQSGPEGFERPVVVKRILPHLARERMFHDMFLDEARIVARLRHPNIVQVQELGDEAGELYLVMEYLEGESLAGLLRRMASAGQPLPARLALHFVAEAAAGLHAAHELSEGGRSLELVHRDVSPHNLFVLYSGQVKVIDFGIAKAAGRTHRTETGTLKGKFAYMAPEQMRAEALDRRVDVFALGVVLYELLTARRLFERDNDLLVMRAVCEEPIAPPSSLRPELDPDLDRITLRALARDREERYPSAAHLRRELVAALSRLPGDLLPEEEAASLLQRAFADRIAAKAEMLSTVRAGRALTHIIGAETSGDAELPAPAAEVSSGTMGATLLPARSARSTHVGLAVGASVVALGGLALGLSLAPDEPPTPGASSAMAAAPAHASGSAVSTAASAGATSSAAAPAPTSSASASASSVAATSPESAATSTARPTAQPAPRPTPKPTVKPAPTSTAKPAPTSKPGGGFSRFD